MGKLMMKKLWDEDEDLGKDLCHSCNFEDRDFNKKPCKSCSVKPSQFKEVK